jgi:hypothetical protein
MSIYKGRCAACNASYNSKAFKSRRAGCDIPSLDERVLEFRHESAVNSKICPGCQFRNRDLLKAKRAREEEGKGNQDPVSKQLKPDRATEQDQSGGGRLCVEHAVTRQNTVRDVDDAVVGDAGKLDAESSERQVEGDTVVWMLLSLGKPYVGFV